MNQELGGLRPPAPRKASPPGPRQILDSLRQLRPVVTTVLVLAVTAGALEVAFRAPLGMIDAPGFAILPGGADVSRLSPITVTFAGAPNERAPESLFQILPETKGSYAWISPRTLLFQPEFPGLLRGSTYTVNVPARPDAGVPRPISHKFTVTGQLAVQQVIPGDGDTEVPVNAQIYVQFSRSVAPLTTLGSQRADPVVTFEPALKGIGEWLNTSIYRFIPAELAPATTYRMRIAKGLSSAADGVLQEDYRWTFSTITPAIDSIAPDTNWIYCGPWQQVDVAFNQPMDPSAAAGLSVRSEGGTPVRGTTTWSEGGKLLSFNPSERLTAGAKYVITLAKGLQGAHGGQTSAERTTSFTVIGAPRVAATNPPDGATNAQRWGINIQFATPMDPASLEGKIRVSGFTAEELEGHVYTGEGALGVNIALKPSSPYTVELLPGATDRYGTVMGGHRFSFTTGAMESSVALALPGYSPTAVYSASAQPILYFQVTNKPSVTFTLFPLTGDEGRRLMHGFHEHAQKFTPSQAAIRTWTETVKGPQNEVLLGSTALSPRGPLPRGYYYLRTDGQHLSHFAFAVVDTVLVTKLAFDELLAWAIDHDTGEPLRGVAVRATGGGVSPEEVVTDANGLASFKAPAPLPGRFNDRSSLLWIDGGGRSAVLSTRWYQGTSPYQLGIPAEYYAREWVGHVYTDRPIYRPGETVEYKGILRADDDAQYSLPQAGATFEVGINNARGQKVKSETVTVNEFGSFAGSFVVPNDAPTGSYIVFVQYAGTQTQQSGITSNSFLISEFRKPEYQVEVTAAKSSYVDGETIDASAAAAFFFGGPLTGAAVDWSALADPYFMRVKGYELYSFTDYDYSRQAVSRDALRAKGKTTTGAGGMAPFGIPATLATAEGAQTFTLSATVADQSGQAVAGSTAVTVHPASFYAGVRPAQYVATSGTDTLFNLVTVDTDGKIVGGRPVTVRVYDRQWITTKELLPGGGRRYRSDPKDTLLATLSATTNINGEAAVAYRPNKPGSLRVVAETTDEKGRAARGATYLWVSGAGFASWQVTNDDAIKLIADKERYEVGDTAQVLVPAPWAGASALISVERGKVITRSVRRFATNSERLAIPITARSMPDVFVSVVLYRPPTELDPIPRYKIGYVQLPVSTSSQVLNVSIRPDRDQAQPGDTVRYAIKVTDRNGKGVRAELSAAVVDRAVLSLEEERGPDGLRAFWFERGLGVQTSSSMAVSVDRWNDVIAEAPKQGKGGATGGLADRLRQDFRNTAHWSAQIRTADDGTASVDVTLPDSLTTWRMQVRAISGDTMVGESTNELLSTKPLLLRAALPRMLRVGDEAQLRVLVRNATKADSEVSLTLKASGVTVIGEPGRSVRVRSNESVAVSWPAKVEAEGTAKLTFTATGTGDLADSFEHTLPILLDVTPETTATGGIVTREGALEAVYLPPFAITTHGRLTVSVQSALVGAMSDELKWLASYPWEGSERIASRLIGTIAVRRAEKSAGGASTKYDGGITSDLAGLIGRQRPDGGWAWCDTSCETDPNVTGWVLLALGEAQRDGLAVDAGVVQRATGYVFAHVNRATDIKYPADPSQKAFLLNALAGAGGRSAAATPARALFEQYRAGLANWGRAYLLLALAETSDAQDDAQMRALFNDLAAATIPSASGNHWQDGAASVKGSFMTTTATTALGTLALARVQPDHQLIAQTVRWLVVSRGADGWQSSIDRAMGILALTTYAVNTGELAGDFAYKVQLGQEDVLTGFVKPGTLPMTASKSIPLNTFKPGATSLLAFTRDYSRPGRLYYTLDLRYVTPAKEIEALNRGFAISHQYTALDDPAKAITSAKLGDTVRVTVTVVVSSDHSYVVVEDPLPSGLEPVDARLRNVDPALKAKLEAERAQFAQKNSRDAYYAPWYRWYYSPWQQVDLRDDRAVLATTRLTKGVYEYVYYARATTPGNFFVSPAHASETYFPEVFGRGDSSRFVVTP